MSEVSVQPLTAAERGALASHPTTYREDVFVELLEWLEMGKTVATFCVEHELPRRTLYGWMKREPDLAARVVQARQLGCLSIEDEMLEIADGRDEMDSDDVQRRKLRLWMREKLLVWHDPSRYGAKQQIEQTITNNYRPLSNVERDIRIKQLLNVIRKPEVTVDVPDEETEEMNDDER